MRLSKRSRYAVVAMVDMANRENNEPVTLAALAANQDISISYLEQIFAMLKTANIVTSVRGPGGGYVLKETSKDIVIADIVRAVDPALGRDGISKSHEHIDAFWDALHHHVVGFLENVNLSHISNGDIKAIVDDR